MRRGFGRSGGAYSETVPQDCEFLPAVRHSADDVLAAITTLRFQRWADPGRILLLGLLTGGLAVLAAGADNPRGVIGIINFDGGRSGVTADGQSCGPHSLARLPRYSASPRASFLLDLRGERPILRAGNRQANVRCLSSAQSASGIPFVGSVQLQRSRSHCPATCGTMVSGDGAIPRRARAAQRDGDHAAAT